MSNVVHFRQKPASQEAWDRYVSAVHARTRLDDLRASMAIARAWREWMNAFLSEDK